ncbi:hypothetical protein BP6252_07081 [Coleophoma cylindrospora]|uniref:DUF7707 domain-containing protein n=1 Tax=Coleophoma cylindrospora TaxID=1849047 RepID=A0A3D8RH09_9HELO|nr:hypothetical protein BP6252_07081 [Coleophoma cylindrospora]
MPSFKSSAAVLAAAVVFGARAQYTIDPNSVPLSTRTAWCQSQIASCPLLCLQLQGDSSTTTANDCDASSLTFDCICGNGLSPNASEYSQTLPYFICTEYDTQCVTACNGDTTCQAACRDDHPCGAQNPTRVNTSTSSSMSSTATGAGSSATAPVVYTGLGGNAATKTGSSSSATSTSKSGAQAALDLGRSYGLAVVFAGLFAGFAVAM